MKNELAFNRRFDNTLLNPEARWEDIEKFVDETLKYNFRNVVVPWYAIPTYVIDKVQGTEVGINVGPGGFQQGEGVAFGILPFNRHVPHFAGLAQHVKGLDGCAAPVDSVKQCFGIAPGNVFDQPLSPRLKVFS